MRFLITAFCALALVGFTAPGFAQCTTGGNTCTTMMLHAVSTSFAACDDLGGLDCDTVPATVDVTGLGQFASFLIYRNYEEVAGGQCAFTVDPSWVFTFGLWDCQGGQVNGTTPAAPWGETSGTIATAFNVVSGGQIAVIGRLHWATAASGCLDIDTESSFPFQTHVIDGVGVVTPVIPQNRGRLCVGTGGYDACDFVVPVEATTWGGIKAQYQQ